MPEVTAVYEQDSKRYHRFTIQENEHGIVGSLYIPKGNIIPNLKQVVVNLEIQAETKG